MVVELVGIRLDEISAQSLRGVGRDVLPLTRSAHPQTVRDNICYATNRATHAWTQGPGVLRDMFGDRRCRGEEGLDSADI